VVTDLQKMKHIFSLKEITDLLTHLSTSGIQNVRRMM